MYVGSIHFTSFSLSQRSLTERKQGF